ncbi:hypothetical protein LZ578_11015 [Jeotgalibaca sp. MA1X17-3]|uniref:hypothetical protein n=1 Tax=Jeotgalibaca sp. MA1X17-3 TaxID=2908211 RepID=UPI001F36008C|nr:hypothetical protein [Jeotgalibaca sp. MA1X17-3]UJF15482.1 hypothetical protein LZ578_11015 [Jeotgalibaca sp. MA1X17-3]
MNYKRIQQWCVSLIVFPLLVACSSTKGVLPQTYDGMKIIEQEEVIAAYSNAQKIIGKEKEDFFPSHMPEYYSQSPLPFLENETVELTADSKIIGVDLPEGRYVVEVPDYAPGASLIIKDQENQTIFQVVLGFLNNHIELNLYKNQSVSLVGQQGSTLLATSNAASSERTEENGIFTLSNGIWKVGEHLPAGSYSLSRPLNVGKDIPYFYIIEENGAYQVHELVTDFDIPEGFDIQVTLKDQQTLYIDKSQTLTFTPFIE